MTFFSCPASLWSFPRPCPAPLQSRDVPSAIFLPFLWYVFPLPFPFCWRHAILWKKTLFEVLLRSCFLADCTSLRLSLWSGRERWKSSVVSRSCHGLEGLWGSEGQCLVPSAPASTVCFQQRAANRTLTSTLTPVWGEVLACALQFCSERENSVPGEKNISSCKCSNCGAFPIGGASGAPSKLHFAASRGWQLIREQAFLLLCLAGLGAG